MGWRAGDTIKARGTGEIGVGVSEVQGPNIKCRLARFIAHSDNTGVVYVGLASGVTVKDGSTDQTTGLQLVAEGDSGWIPVDNLNEVFLIASAASQGVSYMYHT